MHEQAASHQPTTILSGTVVGVRETADSTEVTVSTDQDKDRCVVFRSSDDAALAQRAAGLSTGAEVTMSYRRDGEETVGAGLAAQS